MITRSQDRFILQRTADVMHSAVRHIEAIADWAEKDAKLTFGGMAELRRFLDDYGNFRRWVIHYDDLVRLPEQKCFRFFL